MTRWYIDTSAAAKLLVDEPESLALADELDSVRPKLAACYLLETELRRFVHRIPGLTQSGATDILHTIDLYEVLPSLFREAGLLDGATVRSLDAIHLAAAIRIGVDSVLTYDGRMIEAADAVGLHVVSPGLSAQEVSHHGGNVADVLKRHRPR